MAERRDYNSKMNAKGLEAFVSEEQARHMTSHQGHRYLLIVEVHSGKKVVDEDGSETANLVPDLVELIPPEQEDRVRTFMRALYMSRPDQFGQQAFESLSDKEPTTDEAGAALDAAVELNDDGEPTGMWDGDPDAPVPFSVTSEAQACPFPGCPLLEGHDGDHDPATEPESEAPVENIEPTVLDEGQPEPEANVVSLTHKG